MKSFLDLLPNITKKLPTETAVRDFVMQYLKETCDIEIDRKCIHLGTNKIELRVSPIIKAKFKAHCADCLEKLNEYLKEKGIQVTIKRII